MSRLVAAFAAASFMAVAAVVAPSCASGRSVVFFAPWDGGDAWLVNYTGPFENDRPPHVQVGKDQIKNHTAGEFYCLDNIHVVGKSAIEWDVVGCYNSALKQGAHMTCYYGPNAKSKCVRNRSTHIHKRPTRARARTQPLNVYPTPDQKDQRLPRPRASCARGRHVRRGNVLQKVRPRLWR